MPRAVIYAPHQDFERHLGQCLTAADDLNLDVVGVVRNDYADAAKMVTDGHADAVLVARAEHVPHGPRVVVAAEADADPTGILTVPIRQRRPHPLDG